MYSYAEYVHSYWNADQPAAYGSGGLIWIVDEPIGLSYNMELFRGSKAIPQRLLAQGEV